MKERSRQYITIFMNRCTCRILKSSFACFLFGSSKEILYFFLLQIVLFLEMENTEMDETTALIPEPKNCK